MLRPCLASLAAALVAGAAARADTGSAQFTVAAIVPARVAIEAVAPHATLTLTPADVARGYKDVSARYAVRQSTDRGWLLRLSPRVGITQRVEVRGLAVPLVLQDDTVEVYQSGGSGSAALELEYRFVLDRQAQPGRYVLPVHVTAAAL